MNTSTLINYKYTNNLYRTKQWLNDLPELFAADFEVASKWTSKQKDLIKIRLQKTNDPNKILKLQQQIESNGLSHPSLTVITHLSVAWSDKDSYVIVCDSPQIRDLVFNFLSTTRKTQIWHRCTFDFKHILFNVGILPINYIDTQLMAKSLLNDADPLKDKVSLKELMYYKYGPWAISKDNFTLEEQWNETTLEYAATDACATYALYEDIREEMKKWKI